MMSINNIRYLTDKNIYDALHNHKVGKNTLRKLFENRGIIVSPKTNDEELITYFSQITHGYQDHKYIAEKLGVAKRREKTTSIFIKGIDLIQLDDVDEILQNIQTEYKNKNDIFEINTDKNITKIHIQYEDINYGKTEFCQKTIRDAKIELITENNEMIIRSSQQDYIIPIINKIKNEFKNLNSSLEIEEISINSFSYDLKNRFFLEIALLEGFEREYEKVKLTKLLAYKPEIDSDNIDNENTLEPHIVRVALRGHDVDKTNICNQIKGEEYYFFNIEYIIEERVSGKRYEIEIAFDDPEFCQNFTFILKGIYELDEDNKYLTTRRVPTSNEISKISSLIEHQARNTINKLWELVKK